MAQITVKGISFPIEKIEIVRNVPYNGPEDGVIYLPEDVKLFQIHDTDEVGTYEGSEYVFCDYVGITPWSKEKESISHSIQIIVDGEIEDFPVINSLCFNAYNLFNKFLIYYIKRVAPKKDTVIPTLPYFSAMFEQDIYFKKTIEDEDVMNKMIDYINNTPKGSYSADRISELSEKLERPYAYYKVHGVIIEGDEPLFDVTLIQTDSEYKCANTIKSICRTGIPLSDIEENSCSDLIRRVKEISHIEYSSIYNATLKDILY